MNIFALLFTWQENILGISMTFFFWTGRFWEFFWRKRVRIVYTMSVGREFQTVGAWNFKGRWAKELVFVLGNSERSLSLLDLRGLGAPGNRTCVSGVPVRCSNNELHPRHVMYCLRVNGTSPRQTSIYILMSLANKLICNLVSLKWQKAKASILYSCSSVFDGKHVWFEEKRGDMVTSGLKHTKTHTHKTTTTTKTQNNNNKTGPAAWFRIRWRPQMIQHHFWD